MGKESVKFKKMDPNDGFKIFSAGLKDVALSLPEDERKYFSNNTAFRIISLQATDCWFGFIYTKNGSKRRYREELTPKLKGLEVLGRDLSDQ